MTNIQTNWYVITGAPCSGKTALITGLASRGYQVEPEIARSYIKKLLKYETRGDMASHMLQLQEDILQKKIYREGQLDASALIFFDRGLPDSIAYYRTQDLPEADIMKLCDERHYKGVFFLDALPLEHDEVRNEDKATAERIGEEIWKAYCDLGYEPVKVPVMSIEERGDFVLNHIREQE